MNRTAANQVGSPSKRADAERNRDKILAAARAAFADPEAEVGHCVHRIAMHPSRPDVLYMQKHWDVMRSDDAGESWHEIGRAHV